MLRECPQECGIVSITDVEVSDDFSHATVYISALTEHEAALVFLESKTQELQRNVSTLSRKRIPVLRFRIDPRSDRGERIDHLLS